MAKLKVSIKGTAPLLMHNGQLADPTNQHAQLLKELNSKRKKTEEDLRAIADAEWRGGLYVNEDEEIIIPALNFEASIKNGAKKSKLGKQVQAGLMVDQDAILEFKGSNKKIEDLIIDKNYRLYIGVKVNMGSRIMRTRPMFKDWGATFEIIYNDNVLDKKQVIKSIEDAGMYCGIGDWLPRYGRFEIQNIE
jgi:hypothetical protein